MASVGEQGFPGSSAVKNPPAVQETQIRSLGSPREGSGNPCQYSCLGNPVDRGAWRATVHGVTESDMTEQLTLQGFSDGSAVKNLPAVQETQEM